MPPMTFFEPGLTPRSTRATWSPARAMVSAAALPAGPAPTTTASSFSSSDTADYGTGRYETRRSGEQGQRGFWKGPAPLASSALPIRADQQQGDEQAGQEDAGQPALEHLRAAAGHAGDHEDGHDRQQ